jgi:hypothetical protein
MRSTVEQTIAFGSDGNAESVLVSGWSAQEPHHIWAVGPRSVICLPAPRAPYGYFIEIEWSPYTAPPRLRHQTVAITVNGRQVATHPVAQRETAAFLCPAPQDHERRIVVVFDHPGAERPSLVGHRDTRELALSFYRIRVLAIAAPWIDRRGPAVAHRLTAKDHDGLRDEAEALAGMPLPALFSKFEVIAGNCDMGLALRQLGYESLSLLRFAGATGAVAMRGIETDFDGVGEALSAQVADNPIAEWMIVDEFGLRYHTDQSSHAMDEATVLSRQRRHVTLLRRKLLEDLAEGEKIFVYADHQVVRPLETALPLFLALNRVRPTRMLWVCPDDRFEPGRVDEVVPGLARASLDPFGEPLAGGRIAVGGWVNVLCNAWLLFGSKGATENGVFGAEDAAPFLSFRPAAMTLPS